MRALITGGAGFIGSHLGGALLDAGHHVTALDDLSTGRLENITHLRGSRRFDWVRGSVEDEELVAPLVDTADVVFHLAASVGVRLVVDAPLRTIENNVHGTEVVLRHARRQRPVVVVASTSEVYGKQTQLPFREDSDLVLGPPDRCRWGYAASKLLDEFLALAYWKEHQLPTIVVRFFNTVGPRQSARYGMVLPSFARRAIAHEPLIVHGDGSQTRSFTWVGDVVSALTALVDEPRAFGQVFNVGNREEVSIRALAEMVKAQAGSRSEIQHVPYAEVFDAQFEDAARRVPDISKIQALVGFQPAVQLQEIITRTLAYWTLVPARDLADESERVTESAPAAVLSGQGLRESA